MVTDLDPCLLGCDLTLAEADRLMRLLVEGSTPFDPEITAVRSRIAALREEVERLRGMPTLPAQRKIHPNWIDLARNGSPWGVQDDGPVNEDPSAGDRTDGG